MTKYEKEIITTWLEDTYRWRMEELDKGIKSVEYNKAIARYTAIEILAKELCPDGSTIEEYYGWTEERKIEIEENLHK